MKNTPKAGPADKGPQPPTPFDLWLDRGLHQMFDGVANETIPQHLLDLIEGDRKDSSP